MCLFKYSHGIMAIVMEYEVTVCNYRYSATYKFILFKLNTHRFFPILPPILACWINADCSYSAPLMLQERVSCMYKLCSICIWHMCTQIYITYFIHSVYSADLYHSCYSELATEGSSRLKPISYHSYRINFYNDLFI